MRKKRRRKRLIIKFYIRKAKPVHKRIFVFLCSVVLLIAIYNIILAARTVDMQKYYSTDSILYINTLHPAGEDSAQPSAIKYEDGEIYLPFELVQKYVDGNIYRSEEKDRIIITTGESVIRMRSEDNTAYLNGEEMQLNMPVYDTDYLPASVLEQFYPVSFSYSEENATVTMTYTDTEYSGAALKRSAHLKYQPKGSSLIVKKLKKGTAVTIPQDGMGEKYALVSTQDGLSGYIALSALNDIQPIEPKVETPQPKQLWKCTDGKANIVFDQVTNSTANTDYERIPLRDGVDVICTTWFSFENTAGDIRNLADRAYVDRAHAKGIKVWGLITDNFDSAVSHAVLSNADTREHVIKQLLAYSALYDLDGINIDFEAVPSEDGELYVQFLRELAPMLHNEGITLSADFFVPKPWTNHYNRGRCAEVLDYVIVMGYDQHYAGSNEAGSNAELSWSEEAITATLAQGVPEEKLILGIPFYTRVWTINNQTGELSQKAMGMKAAKDFMTERGGILKWLASAGQNYAEVTDSTSTYKCWFEDSDSVKGRLGLVKQYNIAGVAAWKSGMETNDIWELLKNELKGDN